MRLLVATQAVDKNDPVLGFFHAWLIELAAHCEHVHVVCLKEGVHTLPANVSVHSLGKERGVGRFRYLFNFFYHILSLWKKYDSVFIHMNEEYVLLAGMLWRVSGKRVVLWRNHKRGSWRTRFAARIAHVVCHTSPEAYVAHFRNAVKMPIGIDTDLFRPGVAKERSILFLGRLDPVKRPGLFLQALQLLAEQNVSFSADIYGDPTPGREVFGNEVRSRYAAVPGVSFHNSVPNEETPAIYASRAAYVNLTPSGSFDKTIGEAMAAGCLVVVCNDAVRDIVPPTLFVSEDSPEAVARAIHAGLEMHDEERVRITQAQRAYIEKTHALPRLAQRLVQLLSMS